MLYYRFFSRRKFIAVADEEEILLNWVLVSAKLIQYRFLSPFWFVRSICIVLKRPYIFKHFKTAVDKLNFSLRCPQEKGTLGLKRKSYRKCKTWKNVENYDSSKNCIFQLFQVSTFRFWWKFRENSLLQL